MAEIDTEPYFQIILDQLNRPENLEQRRRVEAMQATVRQQQAARLGVTQEAYEAARLRRERAAVPRVPPLGRRLRGLAFEIHDAADDINMELYMEILNTILIEAGACSHACTMPPDFDLESIREKFLSLRRPEEWSQDERYKLTVLFAKIPTYRPPPMDSENLRNQIFRTLLFVELQNEEFRGQYVTSFVYDNWGAWANTGCTADATGRDTSCVPGIIERFITSLRIPLIGICEPPTAECSENVRRLLDLFKTLDIRDLASEWFQTGNLENLNNRDERRRDFIEFVRGKYRDVGQLNEEDRSPHAEGVRTRINTYADGMEMIFQDGTLGGGGRKKKRKTRKYKKRIAKKKTRTNKRKKRRTKSKNKRKRRKTKRVTR